MLTCCPTELMAPEADRRHLVLLFPNEGARGKLLWAKTSDLASKVPYFQDLLTRDRVGTYGVIKFDDLEDAGRRLESLLDWFRRNGSMSALTESEGSDFEEVQTRFRLAYKPRDDVPDVVESPVHFYVVRHAAFFTYQAVLAWITTGQIRYWRKSLNASDSRWAPKHRKGALPFASPRSVYKLAYRLGLPALCESALLAYRAALDNEVAARELFCESSVCYPELGTAAESFVFRAS